MLISILKTFTKLFINFQGHAKCLNFVLVHGKNISLMSFENYSSAPSTDESVSSTDNSNFFETIFFAIDIFVFGGIFPYFDHL